MFTSQALEGLHKRLSLYKVLCNCQYESVAGSCQLTVIITLILPIIATACICSQLLQCPPIHSNMAIQLLHMHVPAICRQLATYIATIYKLCVEILPMQPYTLALAIAPYSQLLSIVSYMARYYSYSAKSYIVTLTIMCVRIMKVFLFSSVLTTMQVSLYYGVA